MSLPSPIRVFIVCALGVAALATTSSLSAQSTLIPLTTRRDMVFDHAGKYLYVSTSDGYVQRYNLATNQVDNSYSLGGSLNGIDIASDDSFLLVAQNNLSGANASVQKLNLTSGSVSNISYAVESGELGPWD